VSGPGIGGHILVKRMTDDALLREFVAQRSEAAFTELVNRHAPTVYAAALRQTRDPHRAQDVTQAVFILLARKADSLKPGVILTGWLFRAAHFAAQDIMKAEFRRQRRETQAFFEENPGGQAETAVPVQEEVWAEIAPVLDASLARLAAADRHALLLRFFEGRSLAEVGEALGIAEDAARKRVSRALDRLRGYLLEAGSQVEPDALPPLLAARTRAALPPGLQAATVAAALAGPGLASRTAESLSLAVDRRLFWLQARWWGAVGTAAALTVGGVSIAWSRLASATPVPSTPALSLSARSEYRPAGFPDSEPVHRFMGALQQHLLAGEQAAVGRLIHYPLRVNASGATRWIPDEATLRAEFDRTFTPEVIRMVLKCPLTGLYCDNRGVMVGGGELWLAPADPASGSLEPRIFAINLD
jgi:RNA polymerase sigma factor (sigma-70 family)